VRESLPTLRARLLTYEDVNARLRADLAASRELVGELVGACEQSYEDIDTLTDSACGCNGTPPLCTLCRLRVVLAKAKAVKP
jgi:hypothetical protein